jgi:hypothetical protein
MFQNPMMGMGAMGPWAGLGAMNLNAMMGAMGGMGAMGSAMMGGMGNGMMGASGGGPGPMGVLNPYLAAMGAPAAMGPWAAQAAQAAAMLTTGNSSCSAPLPASTGVTVSAGPFSTMGAHVAAGPQAVSSMPAPLPVVPSMPAPALLQPPALGHGHGAEGHGVSLSPGAATGLPVSPAQAPRSPFGALAGRLEGSAGPVASGDRSAYGGASLPSHSLLAGTGAPWSDRGHAIATAIGTAPPTSTAGCGIELLWNAALGAERAASPGVTPAVATSLKRGYVVSHPHASPTVTLQSLSCWLSCASPATSC